MSSKINILWASMSGTAENVAKEFEKLALQKGLTTNLKELDDVSINDLSNMKNVAIITSTTGEGDLPTNGEGFWDDLKNSKISMKNINYSVCALGDSSHDIFCGAGKKVDEKILSLGGNKIFRRQECDGSDEDSQEWSEGFLAKII